jgi:molybdate transport system substrate-binding protein
VKDNEMTGDVRILGTMAVQHAVMRIAEAAMTETGGVISGSFGTAGVVAAGVEAGEPADIVISSKSSIAALAEKGLVQGRSHDLGQVRIALGVAKGVAKPDISSVAALTKTLSEAPCVSFGDPKGGATSGIHFAKVLDRLGLADIVGAKANLQSNGFTVMAEVVAGRASFGFTQASEIMASPGVEIGGYLPDELQLVSTYTAALTPRGASNDAAKAFLLRLTEPGSKAILNAEGID